MVIACKQTLLFGQAKRASRERASEGSSAPRGFASRLRVLTRPISLAQTGELAHRLEWLERWSCNSEGQIQFPP